MSHSWAAETFAKYERDLKYLTYCFDQSKFAVTEKLTNGILVTPPPPPDLLYKKKLLPDMYVSSPAIIYDILDGQCKFSLDGKLY